MFLDIEKKTTTQIAAIDDRGQQMTYGEMCRFCDIFAQYVAHRTMIFIMSDNSLDSLRGFVAALNNHIVPLILSANTEQELLQHLLDIYNPEYIWLPTDKAPADKIVFSSDTFSLAKTGSAAVAMHSELALLLPTSGSTGSPKLIRHSYTNITAQAHNVSLLFNLDNTHRAMAALPMHYTMGLSVVTSHLYAGATLLLSNRSLLDPIFWHRLQDATSFTGVPYSYEIMLKMRFTRKKFPNLKIITQGGGKLTEQMWNALAQYANENGIQFIATYGQSECTARMSYLPADMALHKICSIGIAEPGGHLSIIDDNGNETAFGEATGELIYRGPNVTMGYANEISDLSKGDENNGVMYTGDIAHRDNDGYYYIIGRKKRFLKIFGLRISLDEVETLIKTHYNTDCYAKGDDTRLVLLVTNSTIADSIPQFIEEKTHLFHKQIEVRTVPTILRNEAGKIISQ